MNVQRINFDVDKEYLKIDGKLRAVNNENVVDFSLDLFKEIDEPVYVRIQYPNITSINTFSLFRSKARYSCDPKANRSILVF